MVLRKLDHFLTPYTKINSKWIKDLNVRPETIKLLEENIGSKLFDIGFSNIFLDLSPFVLGNKSKNKLMGLHQTKKLLLSKGNHQQIKMQPAELENIFAKNISNNGLITKIYKLFITLNIKKRKTKTKKQLKSGQRT